MWAADSRRREFAADRRQVQQAGAEVAATALLLVTVTDRLPWVRLSSIARSHVASNEPMEHIFAEHWRRAKAIQPDEWEEACRKELKRKTGFLDSHPSLRKRLEAMGVRPGKAIKLLRNMTGPPAWLLFPSWDAIEKALTEELIAVYRAEYLIKRDMAQIVLGRPLS